MSQPQENPVSHLLPYPFPALPINLRPIYLGHAVSSHLPSIIYPGPPRSHHKDTRTRNPSVTGALSFTTENGSFRSSLAANKPFTSTSTSTTTSTYTST